MFTVIDFDLNYEAKEIVDTFSETVGMKTTTYDYFDGRPSKAIETPIIEKTYKTILGHIPILIGIGMYKTRLEGVTVEKYILRSGTEVETYIQKIITENHFLFIFKVLKSNEIIKKSLWSESESAIAIKGFYKDNE